ncbi:MAG: helix-turn-helix domain-containing protein [Ignavibacteria bacterium]
MREVYTIVGRNIRKQRKRLGLTQEQLAATARLSSDYVSRLELGKENPTVDVLSRISHACDVTICELVKGA